MLCYMQVDGKNHVVIEAELADFQHFPGLVVIFQDFPVLEDAKVRFQDLPGFPGPIRTLDI